MKPMGRLKKGYLVIAIVCALLYGAWLITLPMKPPPVAPITWQVDLPDGVLVRTMLPLPNGNLACVTGKVIYFINPSGEIIQEHNPLGKRFSYGDEDESGNTYIGGDDGYIFSYSPEGKARWKLQLPDRSIVKPVYGRGVNCVVDGNGFVIAQVSSGELAVVSSSGKVLDHAAFPFRLRTAQAPIRVAEDRFAVVKAIRSKPDELTVVDLAGNEIWAKAQPKIALSKVHHIEDVLILNGYQGEINCFSLDGNLLWSFTNPDPVPSTSRHWYHLSSVTQGVIYIRTGRYLFALDRDGNTLWQIVNDADLSPVFDNAGRMLCIEAPNSESDRNVKWPLNKYLRKWSLPTVPYSTSSNLVTMKDQQITQRWRLPDNFLLGDPFGSAFGIDGEAYGFTGSDSENNIPLTIYRIDLEP